MVKATASSVASNSRQRNSARPQSGGVNGHHSNGHAASNGHSLLPLSPDQRLSPEPPLNAEQSPSRRRSKPKIDRSQEPLPPPFIVIYDQREGIPYTFTGLRADASQHNRPLAVEVVKGYLETGDYSIVGLESEICCERKSIDDLYSTLGHARDRFEREHERMAAIVAAGGFACVIIEASLRECLLQPPDNSRLNPKTVDRTRISWMQRYRVPWLFEDGRRRAEVTTYRMLETFWRHREEQRKKAFNELF